MNTQAPPPIKTVYYTDARNDEFSSAQIEPRRIDESYRYIDPRPTWKAARFVAYRLFAMPAAFLYCKLALHARFENRQVLKAGGQIHFKTDNDKLFDWSVEEIPQFGFTLSEVTRDLHGEGPVGVMTDYEAKFYGEGKNINRCVATMVDWTEPETAEEAAEEED